jgi:hypothetical protein
MSARFIVPDHGTRNVKDEITRTVIREFGDAGLEIATARTVIPIAPPTRLGEGEVPKP